MRPGDLAVLIPTSGTTGRSKLVMQTHQAYAMAGEGFPFWMGLDSRDRLMTSLPLFHINAPIYSVLGSLVCGAGLVLLPRFSASGFLDAARRHGATEFNAIGAMLEILMRQPERPDDADNPLRRCYAGPAPERDRQLEIERRFGIEIVVGYAMSESPYGLIWPHGTRPYGTLGAVRQHPYLGTINEAKVLAVEGRPRRAARCDDPRSTRAWSGGDRRDPAPQPGDHAGVSRHAGGNGRRAHGRRLAADRRPGDGQCRRDLYVRQPAQGSAARRGENLSPLEVEEVLDSHPAVVESAVVGVESDLTEEEIKAFVVVTPGAELDLRELREYAAQRLTAFKVPRFWQVIGELPRTPTARLAKHRLPAGRSPATTTPTPTGNPVSVGGAWRTGVSDPVEQVEEAVDQGGVALCGAAVDPAESGED